MGAIKEQDIDNLNNQQDEAGEDIQLTQEQREAVNKAVALVSNAIKAISMTAERLVPTITRTVELIKELAQQAQARLKHQRAVQGLKKDRKKGRRQSKDWKHKAYIIKRIAKAKSSR